MRVEKRLEAARNGESVSIALDPQTGRPLSRQSSSSRQQTRSIIASGSTGSRALPPKIPLMTIKLTLYEEVSAMELREDMVANQIAVVGSVYAQVQRSDALRNAPFAIGTSRRQPNLGEVKLRPNPNTTSLEPGQKIRSSSKRRPLDGENNDNTVKAFIVQVPKTELGYVPITHYLFSQVVEHMPILLERKVTVHDVSCQIALQMRSKLSNRGAVKDFTLVVAIPEVVDGDSITTIRGQGSYDALKRLVKFKVASLNKGDRLW